MTQQALKTSRLSFVLNVCMLLQAGQCGCASAEQREVWDGGPEHRHLAAHGQEPWRRRGCRASRDSAAHGHALRGERPAIAIATARGAGKPMSSPAMPLTTCVPTQDAGRSCAGREHGITPAMTLSSDCNYSLGDSTAQTGRHGALQSFALSTLLSNMTIVQAACKS